MRGFSTMEVLIAMAIMTTMLASVVMVSSGIQTLLPDGELDARAQQHAAAALAQVSAVSQQDFALLSSTSTTTPDGYHELVTLEPWPDDPYAFVRVTTTISWQNTLHIPQMVTETALIGNANAIDGGDTCEPWLTGDWTRPQIASYKIADLLSTSTAQTISDLDVYRGHLYVALSKTTNKTAPTLLVFDVSTTPRYLGGVDNNTLAMNGLASIAATQRYVYAANISSFTKGQLQIFDVRTMPPVLVTTYKINTSFVPTEGLGNSIQYHTGTVVLGLTAVGGSGTELNTIDVHDPLHPSRTSGVSIGRTITAIVADATNRYIATDDTSKEVQTIGGASFDAPGMHNWGYGYALKKVGNTLYLGRSYANGGNELYLLDASHPATALVPLGSFATNSSITDLLVRDHQVFMAASTSPQFRILDASNTAAIIQTATLNVPGHGVSLDCELNTMYLGSNDDAGNGYLSVITPS